MPTAKYKVIMMKMVPLKSEAHGDGQRLNARILQSKHTLGDSGVLIAIIFKVLSVYRMKNQNFRIRGSRRPRCASASFMAYSSEPRKRIRCSRISFY